MVQDQGWITQAWRHLYLLVVAAAAYELAVVTDGSGFIAAWVASFACGFAMRQHSTGAEKEHPDDTR